MSTSTVTEPFDQTVPVNSGGLLTVNNPNGDVTIAAGTDGEVQISAVKTASEDGFHADPSTILAEIQIDVTTSDGNVNVVTTLPVLSDDQSASVKYDIKVPASLLLNILLVNGNITASDVNGDAQLNTTNGNISANNLGGSLDIQATSGGIQALNVVGPINTETTNGDINASVTGTTLIEDMALTTTNGSVTLALPLTLPAAIDAKVKIGSVTNNGLPIDMTTKNLHAIVGTMNGGGNTITVRSLNSGDIILGPI